MIDRLLEFLKDPHNPWALGAAAFFGASLAGLAAQLKTGHPMTVRSLAAAMLNSGFIGAIIALLGYQTFTDNLPLLVGMSLLSGIGGATLLDFVLQIIRHRTGIIITVEKKDK